MSNEAQAWAWKVPLRPCLKAVLNALANRADEEGYCFPGLANLELRTGWSRRAIQNALRELERLSLLTTSARYSSNGHQISNMYRLSMVPHAQGAPDARGGAPDARGGAPDARGGAPPAPNSSKDSSKDSSKELPSNQETPLTPLEGGRVEVMDVGDVSFERFWEAYPRKVGKKAAWASWKKARDKPSIERILQAVQVAKQTRKWREGIIPNPTTWLNQGRWADEVVESVRVPTSMVEWIAMAGGEG